VLLHDPLEKLQRRTFVPSCGDHSLQDFAFMVDRAPEIAELAVDLHKDLVQMPAPLRIAAHVRDASIADLRGEHRAKPVPPEPDRLMADVDPAFGQQILDVAQREWISHVHHHDQTDDLRRAVEISERVAHGMKLPRREAARAFRLPPPDERHLAAKGRDGPMALRGVGRSITSALAEMLTPGATNSTFCPFPRVGPELARRASALDRARQPPVRYDETVERQLPAV